MIGIIPIDSIYTPIVNVRYDIENVRIGEKNDFERLVTFNICSPTLD